MPTTTVAVLLGRIATLTAVVNSLQQQHASVSPLHENAQFELHVLDTPGAVCLDGTPAAFYLGRPAVPSDKWLIWGEGKAWCLSEADCVARTHSTDGRGGWAASGWPKVPGSLPATLPWGDAPCHPGQTAGQAWGCQLSNNCTLNPAFCTFNMVHLKTCDGGSWSGNRTDAVSARALDGGNTTTLHYRGRPILDATAEALLGLGMSNASEIVVGGGSAGALGVYLQLDHWNRTLNPKQDKRFVGLADCGFFQDWNNGSYHQGFVWMASPTGMDAAIDPTCREAHPTAPNLCLMAEHLSPFITTPLFALQAKFDSWQIPNICGSDCATTIERQAYGDALVTKLEATVLKRPGNGAMVDSCYHHCAGYDTYRVDNMTQAQAVQIWYEHGAAALPNEGRLMSSAPYPCAACCSP